VVRLRWHRERSVDPTPEFDDRPQVIPVTEPVTRATAAEIATRVNRAARRSPVVVDLTAIPGFDTDGTAELIRLQDSFEAGRVTIVGLRQATARLIGTEEPAPSLERHESEPWVMRRLRAIAVVQSDGEGPASTDELEPMLSAAQGEEVGIVVVDLRGAILTSTGLDVLAFASSAAALRGQELLIVNADAEAAERLRRAGMSSTTYVAPEPLPES
jgi:anti-anti-sigma regulatory factor